MKIVISTFIFIITVLSCSNLPTTNQLENTEETSFKKAYFASGCFWCSELIYEKLNGVSNVISGYSGGNTNNPTYNSSNTGRTGHAEAIEVTYDPNIISFEELIDIYFASQDPAQVNGQGGDHGSQYRSILFYQNEKEKEIILQKKKLIEQKLNIKAAAEITLFKKFWIAEKYHQDYAKLHPDHPYVKGASIPRLKEAQKAYPLLYQK